MSKRNERKELLQELKDNRNRYMPRLSEGAKQLFYEIARRTGWKWDEMQRHALSGVDVTAGSRDKKASTVIDRKTSAAGKGGD